MLSEAQRIKYIHEIESFPQSLESTLRHVSEQDLDKPYREGGWTVRQVVHHLADSHLNGYSRMKLVHTEEMPVLKGYEQDLWSGLKDVTLPLESSLAILRGLHERWSVFLQSVPPGNWSRTGVHTEHGQMSLDDLLVDYAVHGQRHLEQIRQGLGS